MRTRMRWACLRWATELGAALVPRMIEELAAKKRKEDEYARLVEEALAEAWIMAPAPECPALG